MPTAAERFALGLARLRPGTGPLLVAVSGGVDSMVLLDFLAGTAPALGLAPHVAHVDHGISPESGVVAALVAARAEALGLPFRLTRLGLGSGCSETRARRARYAWLREERARLGARWIVTAHHADDQRETVLMRLLRGSGPAGLTGMPARGRDLLRPLLGWSRRALLNQAQARGLEWWEDPANRDPAHLRSWVRTTLLPTIRGRLPDLDQRLDQSRRHARRQRRAWDELLAEIPGLDFRQEAGLASIAWPDGGGWPAALGEALTAALVRRAGGRATPGRVRAALAALRAGAGAVEAPLGGGWSLERSVGRLVVLPPAEEAAPALALAPPAGEARWGSWRLRWAPEAAPARQGRDGDTAWFIPEALAVRPWRAGDRLAPLGAAGRRLAVRCFQDARVPSGSRARWPMIEFGGQLAWIPGVCRSGVGLPDPGAPSVRVDVGPA